MDNFFRKCAYWFNTYYAEITWFIIGTLLMSLGANLAMGAWVPALFNLIVIAANYVAWSSYKQRY